MDQKRISTMIYLVISIAISSTLFVIFKLFEIFKIDTLQAIVVNYLVAAILGFYLSELPVNIAEITHQSWFIGALILGVLFITVFHLMAVTSQRNGLSVASVASKMSLIIGVIFGIVYYKENFNYIKIVGIVLALLAVYLTSIKKARGTTEGNRSDFLFPLLVFLGSGVLTLV